MESGNVIAQNVHTRGEGSRPASPWVDVMMPPSDGDARDACKFCFALQYDRLIYTNLNL